jgi:hypothetical protein
MEYTVNFARANNAVPAFAPLVLVDQVTRVGRPAAVVHLARPVLRLELHAANLRELAHEALGGTTGALFDDAPEVGAAPVAEADYRGDGVPPFNKQPAELVEFLPRSAVSPITKIAELFPWPATCRTEG